MFLLLSFIKTVDDPRSKKSELFLQSLETETPIHKKALSRDEIGILRGKEDDSFGNIFGLIHSVQVRTFDHILVNLYRESLPMMEKWLSDISHILCNSRLEPHLA